MPAWNNLCGSPTMKINLPSPAIFLTLVIALISCNGLVKTNSPKDTATGSHRIMGGNPDDLQIALAAGFDPYFVESWDTVSKYGPRCITRDLLQDRNGNFWFATWQGIIQYDGNVFTNYTLKESLIHFHVFSCYEDQKGNLWFGTARGGLYRYDPSAAFKPGGKSFTLFTTKDGLAGNSVACFAEDQSGNIWLGTENGVSRFDGKTFTNFTVKDGLCSNNVSSIIRDKTGKLWFGCLSSAYMTDDGGVCCYDGTSFTRFTNKDGPPFKSVVSLFENTDGSIWIGRMNGLCRYDPSAALTGGKSVTELQADFISYYIVGDKAGNVWLTHSEPNTFYTDIPHQVLYKYDGKNFTKVIGKYEPSDCQIFGKAVDNAGNIWFGTMKGPCRYDGKTVTRFYD
jgi:ligand-binding sensor domain-containing protein